MGKFGVTGPKISSVFLLLAVKIAEPAIASQQSGTITMYTIASSGSNAFMVSGSRTAPPACATDPYWSVPASAPNADTLMAAVITARETGRPVTVTGKGTCDPALPTREEINWIGF